MCMKNRFNTFGKQAIVALSLLAACGLTWSCKDDYRWDDEKPTWLNSSIYESLKERDNFHTYLRLLEDKDVNIEGVRNLKDILSKTGSKTVFVADDQAWEEFFKHNATLPETDSWHNATSYENLSEHAQQCNRDGKLGQCRR